LPRLFGRAESKGTIRQGILSSKSAFFPPGAHPPGLILQLAFLGREIVKLKTELEGGEEIWAHSQRVANYCLLLAKALAIRNRDFLRSLALGALFHDIGKLEIPHHILRKPGALSHLELKVVQNHPRRGYEWISDLGFWPETSRVVLFHHERYDGRGYPFGICQEAIPLSAKILSVADALEAMTAGRPYRRGLSFPDAAREIWRCRGAQFDPEVVEAFLTVPFGGSGNGLAEKAHALKSSFWLEVDRRATALASVSAAKQPAARISAECRTFRRGEIEPSLDFI